MRNSLLMVAVGLGFILGCQGEPPAINEEASAQPPKEQVKTETMDLASLEASFKQAEKAFKENPADNAAKEKYIAASNSLAFVIMGSDEPPNKKYPKALAMYREVLKLDPENREAKKWVEDIEAIYESLGRPVPKA
jgi:tetratricopeptide (TPR) repeat protein